MEHWNNDILRLLETKSFHQLTAAEQELVLANMSQHEYDAQHRVIASSAKAFADDRAMLIPDPDILAGLKRKTRKQQKTGFFAIQVPIYQPVLAMLCALVVVWILWPNATSETVEKERIVYQQVTDTVVVEKPVEVPVVQYVNITDTVFLEAPVKELDFSGEEYIAEGVTPQSNVQLTNLQNSYGNTNLDADQLQSFIVGVN